MLGEWEIFEFLVSLKCFLRGDAMKKIIWELKSIKDEFTIMVNWIRNFYK